jgi:hypothetical protein
MMSYGKLRKIGTFSISIDGLSGNNFFIKSDGAMNQFYQQVMAQCTVVQAESLYGYNCIQYTAYCEKFEHVNKGEMLYHYQWEFDGKKAKPVRAKHNHDATHLPEPIDTEGIRHDTLHLLDKHAEQISVETNGIVSGRCLDAEAATLSPLSDELQSFMIYYSLQVDNEDYALITVTVHRFFIEMFYEDKNGLQTKVFGLKSTEELSHHIHETVNQFVVKIEVQI